MSVHHFLKFPIVLVGEAPSRTSDPAVPFSGRSGRRLSSLGLDLENIGRVNLFAEWPGHSTRSDGSAWKKKEAREEARTLAPKLRGKLVVLAGLRVADAFGYRPPSALLSIDADSRGFEYAVIPHPSRVNRWWNEPGREEAVAEFLRSLNR